MTGVRNKVKNLDHLRTADDIMGKIAGSIWDWVWDHSNLSKLETSVPYTQVYLTLWEELR